jgi:hypothetical protein
VSPAALPLPACLRAVQQIPYAACKAEVHAVVECEEKRFAALATGEVPRNAAHDAANQSKRRCLTERLHMRGAQRVIPHSCCSPHPQPVLVEIPRVRQLQTDLDNLPHERAREYELRPATREAVGGIVVEVERGTYLLNPASAQHDLKSDCPCLRRSPRRAPTIPQTPIIRWIQFGR